MIRAGVKRAAALALGFLLAAVLLEAGLQLAGLVLQRTTRRPLPQPWITGSLRVLCLGDSNTFGVYLKPEESYPQQLQAAWNEAVEAPKLEVVNFGYPGMNSSRLARDLNRIMDRFTPDLVIVMIGVNDFWTDPTPLEDEASLPFWKRHSKLYRLFLILRRTGELPEVEYIQGDGAPLRETESRFRVGEEEFYLGFGKTKQSAQTARDQSGRRALVKGIQDRGTPLYIMTYPGNMREYAVANAFTREVADAFDTPLIDLAAVFMSRCPLSKCPELLFPDQHPTRAGYRLVADTIAARLAEDLGE